MILSTSSLFSSLYRLKFFCSFGALKRFGYFPTLTLSSSDMLHPIYVQSTTFCVGEIFMPNICFSVWQRETRAIWRKYKSTTDKTGSHRNTFAHLCTRVHTHTCTLPESNTNSSFYIRYKCSFHLLILLCQINIIPCHTCMRLSVSHSVYLFK